ncbi:MAG: hypothetical protein WCH40_01285 [Verrucomicrobiales bacterium]
MITMNRLLPVALGSLLLASCFPHDPRIDGPRPHGPYDQVQGPTNQDLGPYGNPPPTDDPYGNADPAAPQDPRQGIQDPGPQAPVTPPPSKLNPADYPVAKKGKKPNEVISPYPPNNIIDITGFKSGQMAKDPSNKKIFVVP